MLIQVKHLLRAKLQAIECLFIFLVCTFVYLANGQTIVVNDTFPNSVLALNWLLNHSLNFDAFRDNYNPHEIWYFVEASNGHLTSTYPIGAAIVTFPLYLIFVLYLKCLGLVQTGTFTLPPDFPGIAETDFTIYRQSFQKLAAAIATALSAVLFYLSVRLKFSHAIALITTFVFAFATSTWSTNSQGLWQHTASNLVLTGLMLCLLKANRTEGTSKRILLLIAGIFCGLLPGIRPTSLLFSIAAIAYSAFAYPKEVIYLLVGLFSAMLNATWNFYYFGFSFSGLLLGGYSKLFGDGSSSYKFTFQYFVQAFSGLLFSPNRGLFVFSPVLLFATPGIQKIFRRKTDQDEKLLAWLAIACLLLFIQYCFYIPWWGAISYGSRFLADILPVACYLICYFLASQFHAFQSKRKQFTTRFTIFFVCIFFSTFVQLVGAFSTPRIWDLIPTSNVERFWDFRDSQIERHSRNLFLKIAKPIKRRASYLQNLSGELEQITLEQEQPISNLLVAGPAEVKVFKAKLRNTGKSQWFGYNTGIEAGETEVSVRFLDRNNREVKAGRRNQLYVFGSPRIGEAAEATGRIMFPHRIGEYKIIFDLVAQRIGDFPKDSHQPLYSLDVEVKR